MSRVAHARKRTKKKLHVGRQVLTTIVSESREIGQDESSRKKGVPRHRQVSHVDDGQIALNWPPGPSLLVKELANSATDSVYSI